MTPGTYLRLRREATGLPVEVICLDETALLAIEADERAPTDAELQVLDWSFNFDHLVLISLARGIIPRLCRECGCSEQDACIGESRRWGGSDNCYWVERDLCSACADSAQPVTEGLAA